MNLELNIPEELITGIKREIMREIRKEIEESKKDEVFDVNGLADFLKTSKASTYNLINNNSDFPKKRFGKSYRFLKSEVINWLKLNNFIMLSDFNGLNT